MRKKALITGVTGQDGAILSEFLLAKGYEVHGIKRRSSLFNTARVDHIYQDPHIESRNFILHYGDMADATSLINIVKKVEPDEVYNLAAMSHVMVSFEMPEYTANIDGLGTLRLLDAIRICGLEKKTKFYQASTSEMFGLVQHTPQTETTPFYPRSPYAVAKCFAHWTTINYREAYNMFAVCGILFNHESPLRGETFVTRKITRAVAKIALGLQDQFFLGNLEAKRDWGHTRDYVEAMWLMLQNDNPEDFVIATGVSTSVRDFVKMAFKVIGVELSFIGKAEHEIAIVSKSENEDFKLPLGKQVLSVDPRYYRPTEVEHLIGDASKAKEKLNWVPKRSLQSLINEMVEADIELFRKQQFLKQSGYSIKNEFE